MSSETGPKQSRQTELLGALASGSHQNVSEYVGILFSNQRETDEGTTPQGENVVQFLDNLENKAEDFVNRLIVQPRVDSQGREETQERIANGIIATIKIANEFLKRIDIVTLTDEQGVYDDRLRLTPNMLCNIINDVANFPVPLIEDETKRQEAFAALYEFNRTVNDLVVKVQEKDKANSTDVFTELTADARTYYSNLPPHQQARFLYLTREPSENSNSDQNLGKRMPNIFGISTTSRYDQAFFNPLSAEYQLSFASEIVDNFDSSSSDDKKRRANQCFNKLVIILVGSQYIIDPTQVDSSGYPTTKVEQKEKQLIKTIEKRNNLISPERYIYFRTNPLANVMKRMIGIDGPARLHRIDVPKQKDKEEVEKKEALEVQFGPDTYNKRFNKPTTLLIGEEANIMSVTETATVNQGPFKQPSGVQATNITQTEGGYLAVTRETNGQVTALALANRTVVIGTNLQKPTFTENFEFMSKKGTTPHNLNIQEVPFELSGDGTTNIVVERKTPNDPVEKISIKNETRNTKVKIQDTDYEFTEIVIDIGTDGNETWRCTIPETGANFDGLPTVPDYIQGGNRVVVLARSGSDHPLTLADARIEIQNPKIGNFDFEGGVVEVNESHSSLHLDESFRNINQAITLGAGRTVNAIEADTNSGRPKYVVIKNNENKVENIIIQNAEGKPVRGQVANHGSIIKEGYFWFGEGMPVAYVEEEEDPSGGTVDFVPYSDSGVTFTKIPEGMKQSDFDSLVKNIEYIAGEDVKDDVKNFLANGKSEPSPIEIAFEYYRLMRLTGENQFIGTNGSMDRFIKNIEAYRIIRAVEGKIGSQVTPEQKAKFFGSLVILFEECKKRKVEIPNDLQKTIEEEIRENSWQVQVEDGGKPAENPEIVFEPIWAQTGIKVPIQVAWLQARQIPFVDRAKALQQSDLKDLELDQTKPDISELGLANTDSATWTFNEENQIYRLVPKDSTQNLEIKINNSDNPYKVSEIQLDAEGNLLMVRFAEDTDFLTPTVIPGLPEWNVNVGEGGVLYFRKADYDGRDYVVGASGVDEVSEKLLSYKWEGRYEDYGADRGNGEFRMKVDDSVELSVNLIELTLSNGQWNFPSGTVDTNGEIFYLEQTQSGKHLGIVQGKLNDDQSEYTLTYATETPKDLPRLKVVGTNNSYTFEILDGTETKTEQVTLARGEAKEVEINGVKYNIKWDNDFRLPVLNELPDMEFDDKDDDETNLEPPTNDSDDKVLQINKLVGGLMQAPVLNNTEIQVLENLPELLRYSVVQYMQTDERPTAPPRGEGYLNVQMREQDGNYLIQQGKDPNDGLLIRGENVIYITKNGENWEQRPVVVVENNNEDEPPIWLRDEDYVAPESFDEYNLKEDEVVIGKFTDNADQILVLCKASDAQNMFRVVGKKEDGVDSGIGPLPIVVTPDTTAEMNPGDLNPIESSNEAPIDLPDIESQPSTEIVGNLSLIGEIVEIKTEEVEGKSQPQLLVVNGQEIKLDSGITTINGTAIKFDDARVEGVVDKVVTRDILRIAKHNADSIKNSTIEVYHSEDQTQIFYVLVSGQSKSLIGISTQNKEGTDHTQTEYILTYRKGQNYAVLGEDMEMVYTNAGGGFYEMNIAGYNSFYLNRGNYFNAEDQNPEHFKFYNFALYSEQNQSEFGEDSDKEKVFDRILIGFPGQGELDIQQLVVIEDIIEASDNSHKVIKIKDDVNNPTPITLPGIEGFPAMTVKEIHLGGYKGKEDRLNTPFIDYLILETSEEGQNIQIKVTFNNNDNYEIEILPNQAVSESSNTVNLVLGANAQHQLSSKKPPEAYPVQRIIVNDDQVQYLPLQTGSGNSNIHSFYPRYVGTEKNVIEFKRKFGSAEVKIIASYDENLGIFVENPIDGELLIINGTGFYSAVDNSVYEYKSAKWYSDIYSIYNNSTEITLAFGTVGANNEAFTLKLKKGEGDNKEALQLVLGDEGKPLHILKPEAFISAYDKLRAFDYEGSPHKEVIEQIKKAYRETVISLDIHGLAWPVKIEYAYLHMWESNPEELDTSSFPRIEDALDRNQDLSGTENQILKIQKVKNLVATNRVFYRAEINVIEGKTTRTRTRTRTVWFEEVINKKTEQKVLVRVRQEEDQTFGIGSQLQVQYGGQTEPSTMVAAKLNQYSRGVYISGKTQDNFTHYELIFNHGSIILPSRESISKLQSFANISSTIPISQVSRTSLVIATGRYTGENKYFGVISDEQQFLCSGNGCFRQKTEYGDRFYQFVANGNVKQDDPIRQLRIRISQQKHPVIDFGNSNSNIVYIKDTLAFDLNGRHDQEIVAVYKILPGNGQLLEEYERAVFRHLLKEQDEKEDFNFDTLPDPVRDIFNRGQAKYFNAYNNQNFLTIKETRRKIESRIFPLQNNFSIIAQQISETPEDEQDDARNRRPEKYIRKYIIVDKYGKPQNLQIISKDEEGPESYEIGDLLNLSPDAQKAIVDYALSVDFNLEGLYWVSTGIVEAAKQLFFQNRPLEAGEKDYLNITQDGIIIRDITGKNAEGKAIILRTERYRKVGDIWETEPVEIIYGDRVEVTQRSNGVVASGVYAKPGEITSEDLVRSIPTPDGNAVIQIDTVSTKYLANSQMTYQKDPELANYVSLKFAEYFGRRSFLDSTAAEYAIRGFLEHLSAQKDIPKGLQKYQQIALAFTVQVPLRDGSIILYNSNDSSIAHRQSADGKVNQVNLNNIGITLFREKYFNQYENLSDTKRALIEEQVLNILANNFKVLKRLTSGLSERQLQENITKQGFENIIKSYANNKDALLREGFQYYHNIQIDDTTYDFNLTELSTNPKSPTAIITEHTAVFNGQKVSVSFNPNGLKTVKPKLDDLIIQGSDGIFDIWDSTFIGEFFKNTPPILDQVLVQGICILANLNGDIEKVQIKGILTENLEQWFNGLSSDQKQAIGVPKNRIGRYVNLENFIKNQLGIFSKGAAGSFEENLDDRSLVVMRYIEPGDVKKN